MSSFSMLTCVVRRQNVFFETTKIRNSKGDELERIIALSPAFVDAYLSYGNV